MTPHCKKPAIAVIGGGLAGALAALEAADRGAHVVIFEATSGLITGASHVNEGKIHLGYVYAADGTGRTAHRMIQGALCFRPIMERWLSAGRFEQALTGTTDYIVPWDSRIPPAGLERHMARVDRMVSDLSGPGIGYLGEQTVPRCRRLRRSPYRMGPRDIVAAYDTPERSVDTHVLGDAIAAAVRRHPRIELRLGSRVRACVQGHGGWRVQCGDRSEGPFAHILNAAWEGRRLIDRNSGIGDRADWFTRYKVSVNINAGAEAHGLKNMTATTGSYGDIVCYRSGRIYLNWYADGMIYATTDCDTPTPVLTAGDKQRIYRETTRNLTRMVPALADLPDTDPLADGVIAGGFIVARGRSDIDDSQSQLHQRHAIGLQELAPGYFTLDTGKYTTAPQLALASVDALLPAKVIHAAS